MNRLFLIVMIVLVSGLSSGAVFAEHKHGQKGGQCAGDYAGCAQMCEATLAEFLKKGGKYAAPERVQVMRDCIAICKVADDFTTRGSENAPLIAQAAAQICAKCAKSCAELKDDEFKDCVDACKTCSESCTPEKGK